MSPTWRERRAARRVRTGDGSALPRFRWWQLLNRSVRSLDLVSEGGETVRYVVDVRLWGDGDDGEVRARLYRNGAQHSLSKLPARFPVEGGVLEVKATQFGLRRCHFVDAAGVEHVLVPHPASAEGRRTALERNRPGLSRVVGAIATAAVLVGGAVALLGLWEALVGIPPVVERFGDLGLPVSLPTATVVTAGLVAVVGSIERALRLRHSWLDSLAS